MLSWVQRNADGAQQVLEVGPTLSSASVLFIIDTLNTYSPSSKITDLGRLNTLQKAGETKWDSSDRRTLKFFCNHYEKKKKKKFKSKDVWPTDLHEEGLRNHNA